MSISVVIPCIPNHLSLLKNAIIPYLCGEIIPKEIIVSIAYSETMNENSYEILRDLYTITSCDVKVILHKGLMRSGPNRQAATDLASGDIIVYQDADDVPHERRLEVINFFFRKYDIVHLNHSYFYLTDSKPSIRDLETLPKVESQEIYNRYFPTGKLIECLENACEGGSCAYGYKIGMDGVPIHAGAIAVRKEVFKRVRWKDLPELKLSNNYRMEDFEFNMDVLHTFNKTLIVDAPVYGYRQ